MTTATAAATPHTATLHVHLSAAARSDVADEVADKLEAAARRRGANPRLAHYAEQFRAVAERIDAGLGRTGAWRKARSDAAAVLASRHEVLDYWLTRLHNDLEAESTLVITQPERAAQASRALDALYESHTLGQLIGLRPDRESTAVAKLLATAETDATKAALRELGFASHVPHIRTALDAQNAALAERGLHATSGANSGTAGAGAAEFDALWKRFEGFLADAYDAADEAQAHAAASLRAPHDLAVAKLHAIRRAQATRAARKASAHAAEPTAAG